MSKRKSVFKLEPFDVKGKRKFYDMTDTFEMIEIRTKGKEFKKDERSKGVGEKENGSGGNMNGNLGEIKEIDDKEREVKAKEAGNIIMNSLCQLKDIIETRNEKAESTDHSQETTHTLETTELPNMDNALSQNQDCTEHNYSVSRDLSDLPSVGDTSDNLNQCITDHMEKVTNVATGCSETTEVTSETTDTEEHDTMCCSQTDSHFLITTQNLSNPTKDQTWASPFKGSLNKFMRRQSAFSLASSSSSENSPTSSREQSPLVLRKFQNSSPGTVFSWGDSSSSTSVRKQSVGYHPDDQGKAELASRRRRISSRQSSFNSVIVMDIIEELEEPRSRSGSGGSRKMSVEIIGEPRSRSQSLSREGDRRLSVEVIGDPTLSLGLNRQRRTSIGKKAERRYSLGKEGKSSRRNRKESMESRTRVDKPV